MEGELTPSARRTRGLIARSDRIPAVSAANLVTQSDLWATAAPGATLACMKRTGVVTVRRRTPADDRFILMLAQPSFGRYSTVPEQSVAAMMNARSAVTLVAEVSHAPIGFAIVSFGMLPRQYGPWLRPALASLDAIAVLEGAQQRGVGRTLLGEVERVASDREAVSIHLRTAVSNKAAQALFRRAGFQTVLQIQSFYRGGQDALAMMKLLAK